GRGRLALLELRQHRLHPVLGGGHAVGDVRQAVEHRSQPFERLRLGLLASRVPLLPVAVPLPCRERDVRRRADDDLGLALALRHLAADAHLLAAVELLELLGREVLEIRRLDDGGEAVERRVEGEEARELRASHAEHASLHHDVPADLEWVQASGRGTLHTFTVVNRGARDFPLGTPYVIAIVELAEGPRLMTNLVDVETDPARLRIGMPVEVVFTDVSADVALPRF